MHVGFRGGDDVDEQLPLSAQILSEESAGAWRSNERFDALLDRVDHGETIGRVGFLALKRILFDRAIDAIVFAVRFGFAYGWGMGLDLVMRLAHAKRYPNR